MKEKILIIDDSTSNVDLLYHLFQDSCQIHVASDGKSAMDLLSKVVPHVILLDLVLPDITGIELFKKIRKLNQGNEIPVIVISGVQEKEILEEVKALPIEGFYSKPFDGPSLKKKVKELLKKVDHGAFHQKEELQSLSEGCRMEDILEVYFRLGDMIELGKQHRNLGGCQRMAAMTSVLVQQLPLDRETALNCVLAVPLRDLGLMQIPQDILQKNSSLDYKEWTLVQEHTRLGSSFLKQDKNPLLKSAARVALCHHEHWDGNGYPQKLRGEEIPVEGRLAGLLDTLNSLISNRPYREAHSWEEALQIIHHNSESQFDPYLVSKLMTFQKELRDISLSRKLPVMDDFLHGWKS